MAVEQQYQPLYKQAKTMQYKFNDILGHSNPTSQVLHQEMHQLVTDLELNKHPRDIENRIKVIQNQMSQVEHQGQNLMSYGHASQMHHDFESMRRNVRHFGNY